MRLLALFTILAISTLSSSEVGEQGEITREQKWVTAPPSDENAPNWVGYIWNGVSFQGYICNPGAAFTVIGNAAGCVSATDHVTIMQTSCSDTSVLVGPPGYTPFTCPGEACSVGFIFKNFIDTTTTTIVSCGDRGETTSINFTVYRATTYATTTPTTFTTSNGASTSTLQPGFTTSATMSNATSSSSSPVYLPTASAPSSSDSSNAIALGVGIGLGLPAVLIAAGAWWFP